MQKLKMGMALAILLLTASAQAFAEGQARMAVPAGSALFVEPFPEDKFSLQMRLENELIEYGYKVVSSPDRANFVVRWSYSHGTSTYAAVRVTDTMDNTVYADDSKNPGFGTIINKVGATWGCIKRSIDGLSP